MDYVIKFNTKFSPVEMENKTKSSGNKFYETPEEIRGFLEKKEIECDIPLEDKALIQGKISSGLKDMDDEIVSQEAIMKSAERFLKYGGNVKWMHKRDNPWGKVINLFYDEDGDVNCYALVIKSINGGDYWKLIKNRIIKYWSIGFWPEDFHFLDKDGKKVEEEDFTYRQWIMNIDNIREDYTLYWSKLKLNEISTVDIGSNPVSMIDGFKKYYKKCKKELKKKEKNSELNITKPYENEHSCRLENPNKYDKFRRENDAGEHDGKSIDFIYGIKDGKSDIQAMRYSKSEWSESSAKSHCKSKNGTFEAAKKSKEDEEKNQKEINLDLKPNIGEWNFPKNISYNITYTPNLKQSNENNENEIKQQEEKQLSLNQGKNKEDLNMSDKEENENTPEKGAKEKEESSQEDLEKLKKEKEEMMKELQKFREEKRKKEEEKRKKEEKSQRKKEIQEMVQQELKSRQQKPKVKFYSGGMEDERLSSAHEKQYTTDEFVNEALYNWCMSKKSTTSMQPEGYNDWMKSTLKEISKTDYDTYSGVSGYGADMLPDAVHDEIWLQLYAGNWVRDVFEVRKMTDYKEDWPEFTSGIDVHGRAQTETSSNSGDFAYYSTDTGAEEPPQRPPTASISAQLQTFIASFQWGKYQLEYGLPSQMTKVRKLMTNSLRESEESAILNGDVTGKANANNYSSNINGQYNATTNVEGIDTSGAKSTWKNDYKVLFDGLRKNNFDAVSDGDVTNVNASGGAFTTTILTKMRKQLGKADKGDLVLIVTKSTMGQIRLMEQVETVDKYGPKASIVTGEVGKVQGIPIILTHEMSETMNSSGKYASGASHTKTAALLVNTNYHAIGIPEKKERKLKFTTEDLPSRDSFRLILQMDETFVSFKPETVVQCINLSSTVQ